MLEVPYSKKRAIQYRGPSTSDDYNARIEENYNDLVILYNRARLSETEVEELYRRLAKDQVFITKALDDLAARVKTLEDDTVRFSFYNDREISYFEHLENESGFETYFIPESERLELDTIYGILTITKSEAGSLSKLRFTDKDGHETIPPGLEMRVVGTLTTADTPVAFHDSSNPEYAIFRKPGVIWERNVVVDSPDPDGAELTLYVKAPQDLFTTDLSNVILIHPFPVFGTEIREIAYTTTVDPLLEDGDGYTAFNINGYYSGDADAVGWVIPGGWTGGDDGADTIVDAGPKKFIFNPLSVTALRIVLGQTNWFKEGGKYIYSYGLSHLDLRYDKFVDSTNGSSAYIRFDAPEGETITGIDSVTPQMYNISPVDLLDHFEYEVIWDTLAGFPTTTPVPNSDHVWIKVTLKDTSGWSPSLSGLIVEYH